VESIEFTSTDNCETARTAYLEMYRPVAEKITLAIEDERAAGQLRGPTGFDVQAICVNK